MIQIAHLIIAYSSCPCKFMIFQEYSIWRVLIPTVSSWAQPSLVQIRLGWWYSERRQMVECVWDTRCVLLSSNHHRQCKPVVVEESSVRTRHHWSVDWRCGPLAIVSCSMFYHMQFVYVCCKRSLFVQCFYGRFSSYALLVCVTDSGCWVK